MPEPTTLPVCLNSIVRIISTSYNPVKLSTRYPFLVHKPAVIHSLFQTTVCAYSKLSTGYTQLYPQTYSHTSQAFAFACDQHTIGFKTMKSSKG